MYCNIKKLEEQRLYNYMYTKQYYLSLIANNINNISIEFVNNKQQHDIWNYYCIYLSRMLLPSIKCKKIFIKNNNKYLGIIALSKQYLEICVGLQPISYNYNIGKLLASIIFSKEIGAKSIKAIGIHGKSVQYSRLKEYKFIGYDDNKYGIYQGTRQSIKTANEIIDWWKNRWGLHRYYNLQIKNKLKHKKDIINYERLYQNSISSKNYKTKHNKNIIVNNTKYTNISTNYINGFLINPKTSDYELLEYIRRQHGGNIVKCGKQYKLINYKINNNNKKSLAGLYDAMGRIIIHKDHIKIIRLEINNEIITNINKIHEILNEINGNLIIKSVEKELKLVEDMINNYRKCYTKEIHERRSLIMGIEREFIHKQRGKRELLKKNEREDIIQMKNKNIKHSIIADMYGISISLVRKIKLI